jgi:hypothetical protein
MPGASPLRKARHVSTKTKVYLYARAAGRCEFDDCGAYLLEHYPTFTPGNFGDMGHVWAFSEEGPRGNDGLADGEDLNGYDNLILLCKTCHKVVDEDPDAYTVDVLKAFKKAHEDAVYERTGIKRDSNTVAVKMVAAIGTQKPLVTLAQMQAAVKPLYLSPRAVHEIDLTAVHEQGTSGYWEVAAAVVRDGAKRVFETRFDGAPAMQLSVFGLAPIPLLVLLGNGLGDKVSAGLYQRHRDSEDSPWVWKETGPLAAFERTVLQEGTETGHAALVLSLSGRVHRTRLPADIDERFTIYELALSSEAPGTGFLRTRADLEAFRDAYRATIRAIKAEHGDPKELHIFPAVPAPVAICVGRDVLPKVDPTLIIYDDNKSAGGFIRALEANAP